MATNERGSPVTVVATVSNGSIRNCHIALASVASSLFHAPRICSVEPDMPGLLRLLTGLCGDRAIGLVRLVLEDDETFLSDIHGANAILLRLQQVLSDHKVRASLTTSAVGMNHEIVKVLARYNVSCSVRIHGPPSYHDSVAAASQLRYDQVVRGLTMLQRAAYRRLIPNPKASCQIIAAHDGALVYRHLVDELSVGVIEFSLPSAFNRDSMAGAQRFVDRVIAEWKREVGRHVSVRFPDFIPTRPPSLPRPRTICGSHTPGRGSAEGLE